MLRLLSSDRSANNHIHNTIFIKGKNSCCTASVNTCVVCKTWTYDVCQGLKNVGQLEQLKLEWLYQTLLRWPPNKRVHNTSFIKEKNSWCTASVNTCMVSKTWTYDVCKGLKNAGQLEQLKLDWQYQILLKWPPITVSKHQFHKGVKYMVHAWCVK